MKFKKFAAAAILGASALGMSNGAQAVELGFAPGIGIPGANPCVTILCGGYGPGGASSDLDTKTLVETFNWAATNNVVPRTNPPGPFDNSSQWFINITEAGVIDGVTEAGDAFTEFFTFRLQSTLDATNGPSGTYGIAAGNFHDTHVYMTVVASGTVGAGFAGADIHNLDLTYTSAVFRMFVDGDGTATGEPDVDVQIAEFGGLTDPAGFNVDGVAGVTTLQ